MNPIRALAALAMLVGSSLATAQQSLDEYRTCITGAKFTHMLHAVPVVPVWQGVSEVYEDKYRYRLYVNDQGQWMLVRAPGPTPEPGAWGHEASVCVMAAGKSYTFSANVWAELMNSAATYERLDFIEQRHEGK